MKHPTKSGTRKPLNPTEAEAWDLLEQLGFTVTKRGWPDFMAYKDGKLIVVEVKRSDVALKRTQQILMQHLKRYGVPCYRYDPVNGLKKV